MVNANKILTVSYGTFSCTLEGFDDPFSTMRAIAEYFRDLAADDRYFGAEPPTPDAEMLHRIAEREIQRRVEAKVQANGVILRASDDGASEAATGADAGPAPASLARAAAPAALHTEPTAAPSAPKAAPATATPVEDATDDFARDLVAAKLLRIRAAVAQAEPAEYTGPEIIEADSAAEEETRAAEEAARREEEARAAEEAARREEEARAAEEAARLEEEARAAEEAARREEEARAAEEAARREEEARAAEEAARVEEEARAAEEAARIEEEARSAEEAARIEDADDEDDEDELLADRVLQLSRTQRLDTADEDEDAGFDLVAEDAAPEMTQDRAEAASAPASQDMEEDDEDSAETGADEEILAQDDTDTADDQPDAAEPVVARIARAVGDTGLSPEDEADLFKELAEASSDAPAQDDGRSLLENAAEPDEAAMTRLMKQAETELAGPESRRRLSAIEHLRAAVAATRAERQNPREDTAETAERAIDRFQDDLADVVRPRRPVAGTAARGTARRPAAPVTRIAPLILVSEQRIDNGEAPARTIRPIRPRRLNTGNLALDDTLDDDDDAEAPDNILSNDAGFARFIARTGAKDLTDLIEAAAVYYAEVEGRQSFSRPQLLRKLGELPDMTAVSREEGLRGFGRLLRDGRIAKVRRGQFAVREGSRFVPEARRSVDG